MNYFRNNRVHPGSSEEVEEAEQQQNRKSREFDITKEISKKELLIVHVFYEKEKKEFFIIPEAEYNVLQNLVQFSFQLYDGISIFLTTTNALLTEENWKIFRSNISPLTLYIKSQTSEFEIIGRPDTRVLLDFPPRVYFDDANTLKRLIELDFELNGPSGQFSRDIQFWNNTLLSCDSDDQLGILRRIFTVLKFGGLLLRTSKNNTIKPWTFPICTALSHGGRVIIQLPKFQLQDAKNLGIPSEMYGLEFWNWLLTGSPKTLGKRQVSIQGSDVCLKDGKVVHKRLTSTHSISCFEERDIVKLRNGRQIVLYEEKTLGIPRITESKANYISSYEYIYGNHRHWAMNLSFGGIGNRTFTGRKIIRDGRHGSLYLYHQTPTSQRFGCLLIGLENCEFGKSSNMGEFHGIAGKSQNFTPTSGYKWDSSSSSSSSSSSNGGGGYNYTCVKDKCDLAPRKLNGMIVDLTQTGWFHLMEKYEREWDDSMIGEKIQEMKKFEEKKMPKSVNVDDFVVLFE